MTDHHDRTADLVELHALCAKYMALTSQHVPDRWLEVFTPDVEYSAFGTPYSLERFPALLDAAPRGQFIGNMPVVEFDGDGDVRPGCSTSCSSTSRRTRCDSAGTATSTCAPTDGWRIRRRATTFMRKHGGFDSGPPARPPRRIRVTVGAARGRPLAGR